MKSSFLKRTLSLVPFWAVKNLDDGSSISYPAGFRVALALANGRRYEHFHVFGKKIDAGNFLNKLELPTNKYKIDLENSPYWSETNPVYGSAEYERLAREFAAREEMDAALVA